LDNYTNKRWKLKLIFSFCKIFAKLKKIWDTNFIAKKTTYLKYKNKYKMNYAEPFSKKLNEDIFVKLIKKETWIDEVFLNAIYLKNSIAWVYWSYYIFYYSKYKNTCYINDLAFHWSMDRLSVTNTIEQLSTKILPFIKMTQSKVINREFKIPKFIYYHSRWYSWTEVIRQSVSLNPLYDEDKKLCGFNKPSWSEWFMIIDSEVDEWEREWLKECKWEDKIDRR
jgi:hypothetical protein